MELWAATIERASTSISQFSSGEWIAVIGAISLALTSIITSMKSAKNSEIAALKAGVVVAKADTVLAAVVGTPEKPGLTGQLAEIHTATNSTLSEIRAELKVAIASNVELRGIIKDLKDERNKKELK